ncbi:hypothetical protein ACVWZD_006758 [Streptomyces sp. TE3672]
MPPGAAFAEYGRVDTVMICSLWSTRWTTPADA